MINKEEKLKELKAKLEELKSRDTFHRSGTKGFMDHDISPELFQKIEDLEEELKKLEQQDE